MGIFWRPCQFGIFFLMMSFGTRGVLLVKAIVYCVPVTRAGDFPWTRQPLAVTRTVMRRRRNRFMRSEAIEEFIFLCWRSRWNFQWIDLILRRVQMLKLRRICPRRQCAGVAESPLLQLFTAFLRLGVSRFRRGSSIACKAFENGHGVEDSRPNLSNSRVDWMFT